MIDPIIVVSSGGFGITFVRWYSDVWSAERNHVMMTVTNKGISIHTRYLEEVPESWINEARKIKDVLAADPYADVSKMATHKHSVTKNGPLVRCAD